MHKLEKTNVKAKGFVIGSLFAVVVCLFAAHSAKASPAPDTQLEALFDQPCVKYGVSKVLVLAIARTESSLHPWTVNVAGKSYKLASKEQALRLIHAARARKLSHDIGLMQINSWWLSQLRISPETALEPSNNVKLGVWILAREFQRYGVSWKAVGAYHSPTPTRQAMYARAVARHLRNK